jgi:hypothetical protein
MFFAILNLFFGISLAATGVDYSQYTSLSNLSCAAGYGYIV